MSTRGVGVGKDYHIVCSETDYRRIKKMKFQKGKGRSAMVFSMLMGPRTGIPSYALECLQITVVSCFTTHCTLAVVSKVRVVRLIQPLQSLQADKFLSGESSDNCVRSRLKYI